jgi:hypothetical protein
MIVDVEKHIIYNVVQSLQSHFILTMSHWFSGLPVCFPSQRTRVHIHFLFGFRVYFLVMIKYLCGYSQLYSTLGRIQTFVFWGWVVRSSVFQGSVVRYWIVRYSVLLGSLGESDIAHKILPGAEILHPLKLLWVISNTEIKLTEILEFEPDSTPLEPSSNLRRAKMRRRGDGGIPYLFWKPLLRMVPLP